MPSVDARNFVTIRSYSQAQAYIAKTKPVHTSGNVPLRSDRRGHREFYIHTLPSGAIALRMYRTDVVIYYPDGRIHIDTSYASQSTNAFANQFTPHAVSCYMERGQPVVRVAGKNDSELFICPPGGLIIRPASDPHPDPLLAHTTPYAVAPDDNPALSQQCEKRLNLSRAARARAHLHPLLDYARTLEACGPMPHSAWQAMRGDGRLTHADLSYLTPEDISPAHQDRWPEIVSLCCTNQFSMDTVRVNTNQLRERLTTSLYRQLDVYDYVPLEWGTLPRDIKKYRTQPTPNR